MLERMLAFSKFHMTVVEWFEWSDKWMSQERKIIDDIHKMGSLRTVC